MLTNNMLKLLQLFAGEGAGTGSAGAAPSGEGAGSAEAPGATSDDAGQRLRELGVPEDKIRKHRAGKAASLPQGAIRNAPQQAAAEPTQVAAASEEDAHTEEAPAKMSWDEIMKDPEYNKEMQKTVQAAKRKSQAAEDAMAALGPMLAQKMQEFGMDPNKPDYTALAKRMNGDYAQKAAELGVSEEIAQKLDVQQRTLEQQRNFQYFARMDEEATALKQVFPNFDLQAEMQNPRFVRMVHPDGGIRMSVEDAYYACHRKEIEAAKAQAVQQMTQKQIAANITAQGRRPVEAGSASQAPSVVAFDYSKATKEQREALKAQIRSAKARGEKIYPGGYRG